MDQTIIDVGRNFTAADPILGTVILLLIGALLWSTKQWLKALAALDAEKAARLDDVKKHAEIGESIRVAMQANTDAIRTNLEITRHRGSQ